eukprot:m.12881 g.12881  ORF g.12881 m.12881 type:complete len:67 (-) comp4384_c0_seq1:123-323(-)
MVAGRVCSSHRSYTLFRLNTELLLVGTRHEKDASSSSSCLVPCRLDCTANSAVLTRKCHPGRGGAG